VALFLGKKEVNGGFVTPARPFISGVEAMPRPRPVAADNVVRWQHLGGTWHVQLSVRAHPGWLMRAPQIGLSWWNGYWDTGDWASPIQMIFEFANCFSLVKCKSHLPHLENPPNFEQW
jgi:hypothetical protein